MDFSFPIFPSNKVVFPGYPEEVLNPRHDPAVPAQHQLDIRQSDAGEDSSLAQSLDKHIYTFKYLPAGLAQFYTRKICKFCHKMSQFRIFPPRSSLNILYSGLRPGTGHYVRDSLDCKHFRTWRDATPSHQKARQRIFMLVTRI